MLESLHVKNLALIDETEVVFGKGLNILTGETGAGKSILIGSINLALGAKADKDIIRSGADYASVELVFTSDNRELSEKLKEHDIPVEDNTIILSRRIMPSRSICKVNGEVVSARQLAEISQYMIDIHGQHEHQSLLQKKKQFDLLDEFAGPKLQKTAASLKTAYQEYQELTRRKTEELLDEVQREKELSLARFEADEIIAAAIQPNEDEMLEQQYQKMIHSKKIMEGISQAYSLTNTECSDGALEQVGRALRSLIHVSEFDPSLSDLTNILSEVESLLNDFNRQSSDYMEELEFDQETFYELEKRLDLLNHLKAKYGNTLQAVMEYLKQLEEKITKYEDYDQYKMKLLEDQKKAAAAYLEYSEKAHKLRLAAAKELSKSMKQVLLDLNFLNVEFDIIVEKQVDLYSPKGFDQVEFLISMNPGEPPRSLSLVASGGELSRIMLALKTVFAKKDEIETLVFDEIDAGISGRTAWKVSEKLGILGRDHQVLCITHLPQIAAMADCHFLIEKSVKDKTTVTQILKIEGIESINELARLLGSEDITEAVILNAKEMKELAENKKSAVK